MKIKTKILNMLCSFAVVMAGIAVNSACYCRYYQEKMDPQLDVLKKSNVILIVSLYQIE